MIRGEHNGFTSAKVRHVLHESDVHMIHENCIVVIPNGSPMFESAAYKAANNNCILISETGGKLCHLAIVGREYNLTFYMLPDALKLLPNGCNVNLHTESDSIKVLDLEGEEYMTRLKMKISGLLNK